MQSPWVASSFTIASAQKESEDTPTKGRDRTRKHGR
jgi:hypothetical protein